MDWKMVGVAPLKIWRFCSFAFLSYDSANLRWLIIGGLHYMGWAREKFNSPPLGSPATVVD